MPSSIRPPGGRRRFRGILRYRGSGIWEASLQTADGSYQCPGRTFRVNIQTTRAARADSIVTQSVVEGNVAANLNFMAQVYAQGARVDVLRVVFDLNSAELQNLLGENNRVSPRRLRVRVRIGTAW